MAGLAELFPFFADLASQNQLGRDRAGRAQGVLGAETLLGAPAANAFQTDQQGLTSGVATAGSGLLAAGPRDFGAQQRYGLGLLADPYTAAAGQQFLSQVNADFLAQPGRDRLFKESQRISGLDEAQRQTENQLKADALVRQKSQYRGASNQYDTPALYQSAARGMGNDYRTDTKDLRQSNLLARNVQNMIAKRGGVANMTIVDQVLAVKTLVKSQFPDEAVMGEDIRNLENKEGLTGGLRSAMQSLGSDIKLTPAQMLPILESLQSSATQNGQQLESVRATYLDRAERAGINPDDVVLAGLDSAFEDLPKAGSPAGTFTPEEATLQQQLDDQFAKDNPSWFDPLVSGWRELRR
jgi:hypothetical protein